MIGGVGGQGLVLTTDIISNAAFLDGYEIASNDVIGLSQRGGKIFGSVRFGEKVTTPNFPKKSVDVLLGLEELETLRYLDEVKEGGTVLMNKKKIMPNLVIMEKENYPTDIEEQIKATNKNLMVIDTEAEARKLGNIKVANTILLGVLSKLVSISEESFKKAITTKVPPKTVDANIAAFEYGRTLI